MINNILKRAEYKLSQHKQMGTRSNLSVFEVALLMDTIKKGASMKDQQPHSLFFSYNAN